MTKKLDDKDEEVERENERRRKEGTLTSQSSPPIWGEIFLASSGVSGSMSENST
jgi:hypothetical protein